MYHGEKISRGWQLHGWMMFSIHDSKQGVSTHCQWKPTLETDPLKMFIINFEMHVHNWDLATILIGTFFIQWMSDYNICAHLFIQIKLFNKWACAHRNYRRIPQLCPPPLCMHRLLPHAHAQGVSNRFVCLSSLSL